jgi:hypothetical protein
VAAAASLVPLPQASPTPPAQGQSGPDKGGGYQVTQHVLRYYQTARV